ENCYEGESPQHKVTLTRSFFIGKYEVTQAEWIVVMGNNPSKYKGRNHPVEQVSWNEAQAFISALNQKEGITAYRLPTEAEWEYAARAGSTTTYSYGDNARQLGQYAWYDSDTGTQPVGQLQPNKWGLYDIHGNVLEWVQDWYEEGYYANSSEIDPQGPPSGSYRVIRGGGWYNHADGCRSAIRSGVSPDGRSGSLGFRVALPRAVASPPQSDQSEGVDP
ncbi:formylglycine-generating enzyme family protein, partial [Desulfosarcina sp. OttesenSCG-928-A07]|nr:formylglycine-generating enzyme family protein [Desulfosarcina sp. OttesenSCG-928-A07]